MNTKKNFVLTLSLLLSTSFSVHAAKVEVKKTEAACKLPAEALITIDGKVVVTVAEFEKFVEDAAKTDAQLKMLIEQARAFVLPQLVEIKKQEAMINHWATVNKIKEKADYQKKLAEGLKALEQMLSQEEFVVAFRKDPTEAEIVEYYNKNKQIDPVIAVQQPGIKARGLVFEKEEDAKAALNEAGADAAKLSDHAKKINKKIADFGVVNEMSMVDPSVKEALQACKAFPHAAVIKTGEKEFVLVQAHGKQEGKYKDLKEVKELIKQRLAGQKLQESIQQANEKLSRDYKIEVNKAYTEKLNKEAEKMVQQQQEAQKQAPKNPAPKKTTSNVAA
jgi:hypothetical protein